MFLRAITILLAFLALPAAAQSCGSRLYVSGFFSTVHVFDACTGQYLRDLDARSRLSGAMAVRLGPDGFLYAVAETGAALGPAFPARASGLAGPDNGMTFGPDGNLYVPGYDSNSVVRWDPRTGATASRSPRGPRASSTHAACCPRATASTSSSRARAPAPSSSGTSRAARWQSSPPGWSSPPASTTAPTACCWFRAAPVSCASTPPRGRE